MEYASRFVGTFNVLCWRLLALHLLVLNAINSYALSAAEAEHNTRILSADGGGTLDKVCGCLRALQACFSMTVSCYGLYHVQLQCI